MMMSIKDNSDNNDGNRDAGGRDDGCDNTEGVGRDDNVADLMKGMIDRGQL